MDQALSYVRESRDAHLEALKTYLRIPSVSALPSHKEDVARCAEFSADLLRETGAEGVEVHNTPLHPIVTGHVITGPDRPTVMIYGHYDVQPVDPVNLWDHPPFEPHQVGDRLFARGTADDKGQFSILLRGMEALLKTDRLGVNVKFLLEGEEEIGSPSLPDFMEKNRELLAADVAIVADSGMWGENKPAITLALRGLVNMQVRVDGPSRDLHSGSFGGAVANPVEVLARLLASAKDDQGRIVIPGFYDDVRPLPEAESCDLNNIPFDETAWRESLGIKEGWGEADFSPLQRMWCRPTFEINGLWGGFMGEGAKTVLPASAFAKLSLRLVPDQEPEAMLKKVESWLLENAPPSVKLTFTRYPGGGKPIVVPSKSPAIVAAQRGLKEAFGADPVLIREGGSIPVVADFKDILGMDTLMVGFSLPDSRTHSPNENIHIPTFFTGIESMVRIYHYLAERPPQTDAPAFPTLHPHAD